MGHAGGNDGFVSLSNSSSCGRGPVDASLESELTALVRQGVPLLVRRRAPSIGKAGRGPHGRGLPRSGGDAEEVGFLGDDALLLRCAVDEPVGAARAPRILVLSAKDRPCAPPCPTAATAFLGGGEHYCVGLDGANPAL